VFALRGDGKRNENLNTVRRAKKKGDPELSRKDPVQGDRVQDIENRNQCWGGKEGALHYLAPANF